MSRPVYRVLLTLAFGLGLALPAGRSLHADDYTPPKPPEAQIAAAKTERAKAEKALAADPKNKALRLHLGEILCDLGADGDEDASDAAVKLFDALHKDFPQDAEIWAEFGNATTIYAQFASILTKLSWVHDGFDEMDAAVKSAPDNVGARVVRALNSSQVPAFLDREQTARDDFAWLLQRFQANPKDFPPDTLRDIYYYDGLFALNHGEAACVQLLTQAAAVPPPPGDTLAARIAAALKTAHAKFPPAPAPKAT